MKIGSKFKIARRLGAPIFEKCQTEKFALSLSRKSKTKKTGRRGPLTDFGAQLIEKQKARLTYGLSERQFSKYVKEVIEKKYQKQDEKLSEALESRLDNVVYRLGIAPTRRSGRQFVSHGHLMVNGKKVTIPSYSVKKGEKIAIRDGSKEHHFAKSIKERYANWNPPSWLAFNPVAMTGEIKGVPHYEPHEQLFDLKAILEFYRR
ncbi:MAG: 30S ribosomal protein S4 [Candidatus Paceibacterota bacterium]